MFAEIADMKDYSETYNAFELEVPEYFNFGFDVVDRWAEDHTKLALVSVDSEGGRASRHRHMDQPWLCRTHASTGSA